MVNPKKIINNLAKRIPSVAKKRRNDRLLSSRIKSFVTSHSLAFAILFAITIALILTFISVLLYIVSGTSKLDLSRPGYESTRTKIHRTADLDNNFSANGNLDFFIVRDFLKNYDKEAKNLSQFSEFNENIIDDAQLGISNTQIAPSDGANPQ